MFKPLSSSSSLISTVWSLVLFLVLSMSMFTMNISVSQAAPKVPSAAEIKAKEEQKYAKELVRVNKMNAVKSAAAAKELGFPYLLAHYAGRSTSMILPGIDQKEYKNAQARCPVLILDGMGDTIYGNNHMAYRKAMTNYAAQFNKITYKACNK